MTRRDLLRAGAAIAGATTTGWQARSAAAQELTHTTLDRVLRKGAPGTGGYARLVARKGEPHLVRAELGVAAKSGRRLRRRGLIAFAQITDVHVVDAQSPLRVEWVDRFDDQYSGSEPTTGLFGSAYRPQEMLSAHIAEAMVRAINAITRAPVTKRPLAFALQTGDNSDNCQYNEVRWNIDVLDGGTIRPDSGSTLAYEGVMDNDPIYYDVHYWHPHNVPLGKQPDKYKSEHGFPTVPGLLNAARRPFTAPGLDIPWYAVFGNHDGLVQGNFPHTLQLSNLAVGPLKVISPPAGVSDTDVKNALGDLDPLSLVGDLVISPYIRAVTPDPDRRSVTRQEIVEEHFTTTGLPVGHGFTAANRADGTAYYYFDEGDLRHVVMDSVNPNGYADGSLDPDQFAWLKTTIEAATGKAVLVYSHHTSGTMSNPLVLTGADTGLPRVLGDEVVTYLLTQPHVIAWVNGHTHRNSITAHKRADGAGGFWEINTAAHIDYPQQARIIEVADNLDGTWSILTTIIDHAAPLNYNGDLSNTLALASLSRELSANDPQNDLASSTGTPLDRNTELLVDNPLA